MVHYPMPFPPLSPSPAAPETLRVELGERSYPIFIGSGLIGSRELLAQQLVHRDILLLTNTVVAPLYADVLEQALTLPLPDAGPAAPCGAPRRIVRVVLPDGEQHKTLPTASRVLDVLVANRFGRDALLVALGGGVVGDLGGFVAACYQRGIDFAQVPTTLLAHVDSAVGGKTAVNHPGGKNLIGAFHQPRAVIADTDLLRTLPDRELSAGLAEVIKYGLIRDAGFFGWIEEHIGALLARETAALTYAIRRSCEIKAQIVGRDEHERGERALLNLGHTFGHAIEAATGYVEWLHGEAVAVGLLIATDLAQRLGRVDATLVPRLRALLQRARLPVQAPPIGAQRALDYMHIDKKVQSGRVRLVLPLGLGDAGVSSDYPDAALAATLAAWFGATAGAGQ
jgi:3-dehydroquinate synthase